MRLLIILCTVVCGLSACRASLKTTLDFNPADPIRVAVLPVQQVDSAGVVVEKDSNVALDSVPLVSSKLKDLPAVFLRKLIQSKIQESSLDMVAPGYVDTQLVHHGFGHGPLFDREKINAASTKALCEMLTCDAVLYGTLLKWDRSYYAIQSVSSVAFSLQLVRAADGKVIYSAEFADSASRGITKGPTGISSVVLEPIRGLDNEIITDLATNMVAKALKPFSADFRPDFLDSYPPAILASSHDGTGRVLTLDNPLTVLCLGSPKEQASFSIGSAVEHIPMVEKDEGHYIGEYFPLSQDRFNNQSVVVFLTDEYGRGSRQTVGIGTVSTEASR